MLPKESKTAKHGAAKRRQRMAAVLLTAAVFTFVCTMPAFAGAVQSGAKAASAGAPPTVTGTDAPTASSASSGAVQASSAAPSAAPSSAAAAGSEVSSPASAAPAESSQPQSAPAVSSQPQSAPAAAPPVLGAPARYTVTYQLGERGSFSSALTAVNGGAFSADRHTYTVAGLKANTALSAAGYTRGTITGTYPVLVTGGQIVPASSRWIMVCWLDEAGALVTTSTPITRDMTLTALWLDSSTFVRTANVLPDSDVTFTGAPAVTNASYVSVASNAEGYTVRLDEANRLFLNAQAASGLTGFNQFDLADILSLSWLFDLSPNLMSAWYALMPQLAGPYAPSLGTALTALPPAQPSAVLWDSYVGTDVTQRDMSAAQTLASAFPAQGGVYRAHGSYVCRIGQTRYTTLQAALDAITAGTATDLGGASGTQGTDYKIEMLVDAYSLTASHAIPSGKKVTLTTAPEQGGACTIARAFNGGSMFTAAGGGTGFTLENLVLDGAKESYGGSNGAAVYLSGGAGLTMNGGAVIQNSKASYGTLGGAVYLAGEGTHMEMHAGSMGQNCGKSEYYGAFLYQESGTSFTADGGVMRGNSNSEHLGSSGGAIMQAPYGSNITTTLTGNFEAYNNSTYANGSFIHSGNAATDLVTVSGNAHITGNRKTGAGYDGGAIFLFGSGSLHVQDAPVVTGNTQSDGTTQMNVYTGRNTNIQATGSLTGGQIGVYSGWYQLGQQFGVRTGEPAGALYTGLEHFTNDRKPGYTGARGAGGAVVWDGTCQIIRAGRLVDVYPTLAQACAAAQAGDVIEVYRSHELTQTASVTKANVTIRTAPLSTPSAAGARVFMPQAGETKASVVRSKALNAAPGTADGVLTIAAAGTAVNGIILDGGTQDGPADAPLAAVLAGASVTFADGSELRHAAATGSAGLSVSANGSAILKNALLTDLTGASGSAVSCAGSLVLDSSTVTGNTSTAAGGGAVLVSGSGAQVSVKGAAVVYGNTDQAGNNANLNLASANGLVRVLGALDSGASIGVTVTQPEHVDYHRFAQAYLADGSAVDTAAAAASLTCFSDDRTPRLSIGANQDAALPQTAGYDTYLYFRPAVMFRFNKVKSTDATAPLAGAQFHLYAWSGTGRAPEGYLAESALTAQAGWTRVAYTQNGVTTDTFTSASDGAVDCGRLSDGTYRLVEVQAPDGCALPGYNWQLAVRGGLPDGRKVTGTVLKPAGSQETAYNLAYSGGAYQLSNAYVRADVQVSVRLSGSYANLSAQIPVVVSWTENGAVHTENRVLGSGQTALVSGIAPGTVCTVTAQNDPNYVFTVNITQPTGGTLAKTGSQPAAAGALGSGTSAVEFIYSREVVPTGVHTDTGPWLVMLACAGALAALRLSLRPRRRRS